MVKRRQVEQGFRFEFRREIGQDCRGKGYIKVGFSVSVSDLTIQSTGWTESGERALSRGRKH